MTASRPETRDGSKKDGMQQGAHLNSRRKRSSRQEILSRQPFGDAEHFGGRTRLPTFGHGRAGRLLVMALADRDEGVRFIPPHRATRRCVRGI